jgi:hypothetical protein
MLPVVGRLSSLSTAEWQEKSEKEIFASFTEKHLLASYSTDELATEFQRMTGYEIKVSMDFLLKLRLI